MKEGQVAILLATLGAAFFLIGYLYLSGYYGFFGIQLSEIGFEVQEIAIHAWASIIGYLARTWLIYLVVLFFGVLFVFRISSYDTIKGRSLQISICITAGLTLIFLLSASRTGRLAAEQYSKRLPVVISISSEMVNLSQKIPEYDTFIFRQIYITKDSSFLLMTKKSGGSEKWVVRLDRGDGSFVLSYLD